MVDRGVCSRWVVPELSECPAENAGGDGCVEFAVDFGRVEIERRVVPAGQLRREAAHIVDHVQMCGGGLKG